MKKYLADALANLGAAIERRDAELVEHFTTPAATPLELAQQGLERILGLHNYHDKHDAKRIARETLEAVTTPPPEPARVAARVRPYKDLIAARRIAADMSHQTGRNYENFTSGRYDHAFGVRTALAAIEYGRSHP